MQDGIRSRMINGTKVLWSAAIYVPAICIAVLIAQIAEPLLAPYERPPPDRTWEKSVVLFVVFWGAVLIASRFFVWKPLRQLYLDIDDRPVFWTHCKDIARQAFPCAPLMALPLALLVFDIGGWFFFLQLGVVLAADHYFERFRKQPIIASVDALLRRV